MKLLLRKPLVTRLAWGRVQNSFITASSLAVSTRYCGDSSRRKYPLKTSLPAVQGEGKCIYADLAEFFVQLTLCSPRCGSEIIAVYHVVQCITWPVAADSCSHADVSSICGQHCRFVSASRWYLCCLASLCLDHSMLSARADSDDMYKQSNQSFAVIAATVPMLVFREQPKHERCATDRASDSIDQGHPSHIMLSKTHRGTCLRITFVDDPAVLRTDLKCGIG